MNTQIKFMQIGRLLMILAAVVLLVSSCGKDRDGNKHTGALETTEIQTAVNDASNQGLECWQGNILAILYDTIGSTVVKEYDFIARGSLSLMMIGFAVWVALRLLKFVSSVTESSPAEIWNEILKKAFVCLVCGVLASSTEMLMYVMNFFLLPIYGAFLEFGSRILSLAQSEIMSVTVFGEEITYTQTKITCAVSGDTAANISNALPPAFRDTMNCMICTLVDRLKLGRLMALTAMSMDGVLPFFTGLLVWAIFIVVALLFVFYLIDSIFRLGIIILMLPIFILAYAFGPTKKWTGIGFSNMMYSAVYMMAFSILIATALLAVSSLITENGEIFNPANPEEHFRQISVATLCLLLVGCLIWKSLDVAQQLASSLIGAQIENKFQQNAKAVAGVVLGWITGGLGWAFKKTGFYEKTRLGRGLKRVNNMKEKLDQFAGRGVRR